MSRACGGGIMTNIKPPSARIADWLCLAAAPSCACMALLNAAAGGSGMICSASRSALSADGMTAMYLLMAAFHLPPWLRRVQRAAFHAS